MCQVKGFEPVLIGSVMWPQRSFGLALLDFFHPFGLDTLAIGCSWPLGFRGLALRRLIVRAADSRMCAEAEDPTNLTNRSPGIEARRTDSALVGQ